MKTLSKAIASMLFTTCLAAPAMALTPGGGGSQCPVGYYLQGCQPDPNLGLNSNNEIFCCQNPANAQSCCTPASGTSGIGGGGSTLECNGGGTNNGSGINFWDTVYSGGQVGVTISVNTLLVTNGVADTDCEYGSNTTNSLWNVYTLDNTCPPPTTARFSTTKAQNLINGSTNTLTGGSGPNYNNCPPSISGTGPCTGAPNYLPPGLNNSCI